jgi:hypothetical protein
LMVSNLSRPTMRTAVLRSVKIATSQRRHSNCEPVGWVDHSVKLRKEVVNKKA